MCLVAIMKWAPLSENMFQWIDFKVMGKLIDLASEDFIPPAPIPASLLPSNVKEYIWVPFLRSGILRNCVVPSKHLLLTNHKHVYFL